MCEFYEELNRRIASYPRMIKSGLLRIGYKRSQASVRKNKCGLIDVELKYEPSQKQIAELKELLEPVRKDMALNKVTWPRVSESFKDQIPAILEKFVGEYDFLYNYGDDHVSGYYEALMAGDDWIRKYPAHCRYLCQAREDIFSSDREVAALGFALSDLEMI